MAANADPAQSANTNRPLGAFPSIWKANLVIKKSRRHYHWSGRGACSPHPTVPLHLPRLLAYRLDHSGDITKPKSPSLAHLSRHPLGRLIIGMARRTIGHQHALAACRLNMRATPSSEMMDLGEDEPSSSMTPGRSKSSVSSSLGNRCSSSMVLSPYSRGFSLHAVAPGRRPAADPP